METLLSDGRMKDLSGHVHHGTLSGTTDVPGKFGRARHFNGIGDRITAPAISVPATDFTVAAWFRWRSEEHTYELQSPCNVVCCLLLGKTAGGRFAVVFYQAISPDIAT